VESRRCSPSALRSLALMDAVIDAMGRGEGGGYNRPSVDATLVAPLLARLKDGAGEPEVVNAVRQMYIDGKSPPLSLRSKVLGYLFLNSLPYPLAVKPRVEAALASAPASLRALACALGLGPTESVALARVLKSI
jgi:hypothetical protein